MTTIQEIRELFLYEFIKRAIIYSKYSQYEASQKIKSQENPAPEEPIILEDVYKEIENKISSEKIESIAAKQSQMVEIQRTEKPELVELAMQIPPAPKPILKPAPPIRIKEITALPIMQNPASIAGKIKNFAKIDIFLAEPSINSIDCPGPNRPIIVNRRGMMQTTNVMFTAEEIQAILQEFAEKTKIPISPGTYRVAMLNITFTALISDFIEPRFLIQKRLPPTIRPRFRV